MSEQIYDVIVVGGGPAGLTAAIYARRAGKSVLVIEKQTFGGQITFSPKVENIPGFASVSGNEFAEQLVEQALGQGADVELAEVLSVKDGAIKTVVTDGGECYGRTVILSTGARHRTLGLPGEEKWIGEGISFCAVCDGAFYEGRTVAVIGGGNSALQEAILLCEQSKKVYVVQNLDELTGEQQLRDQLYAKENAEIITGHVVDALLGEEELTGIRICRVADGSMRDLAIDGLFIAIGLLPQNEPFRDIIALDGRGYADADETCLTGTPGIFVAGDCRRKSVRQVTTAASDGAVAAIAACNYLENAK